MLPLPPVSDPDQPDPASGDGSRHGPAVVAPTDAGRLDSPNRVDVPAGAAFRVAPLLHVAAVAGGRLVLVGHTRVIVIGDTVPRFTTVVTAAWVTGAREDPHRPRSSRRGPLTADLESFEDWQPVDVHPGIEQAVDDLLGKVRHASTGDPEARATAIAKALAEQSRNAVEELRAMRYGLERLLADELRQAATRTLERLLADLLELSNAASRARDQAREAAREGLWTWRTDDAAYHAQRSSQDARLAHPGMGDGDRPWLRTLDAAVRHCQAIDRQLGEETSALRGLLNATATISVTRDARASETFNLVASVGGVMLGLPALVLTLYGASAVLPLSSNYLALAPLAVAGLLAAGIAAYLPGRERSGKARRFGGALLAVLLTLLLLAGAGALVESGRGPVPAPTGPVAPASP